MKRKKKKRKELVVRSWSLGSCPTADEVRTAWANRRASTADFIWLLSVLGELTCFTDCNLKHLGGFGNIAGRQGGLKAWLERETPELAAKYKSISRHATLAMRIKRAFNYYPPAPLSLLHPDLPKPPQYIPEFILHYAGNLGERYFRDVAPTYIAFKALADSRPALAWPNHKWGPALPQSQWKQAENAWWKKYAKHNELRRIHAEDDYTDKTSRAYNPYTDDYRYWHGEDDDW